MEWLLWGIATIGVLMIGFIIWLIVKTFSAQKRNSIDDIIGEGAEEAGRKSRPGIMSEK